MSEKQTALSLTKEEFPSDASSLLQILVNEGERTSPYAEDAVPEFELPEPSAIQLESLSLEFEKSSTSEIYSTDFEEQKPVSPIMKEASPELWKFNRERVIRENEVEPIKFNEMKENSQESIDCLVESLVSCALVNKNKEFGSNIEKASPCIVFIRKGNEEDSKLASNEKEINQELSERDKNDADLEQNGSNDFVGKLNNAKATIFGGYFDCVQEETAFDKSSNFSESKTDEILENSQCYLETQTYFKEVEFDVKNTDSQNLTDQNISSLSGELFHSTPERNIFGDSLSTPEEKFHDFFSKCDIKNIDSQNLISESTSSVAGELYYSMPGKTNYDDALSPSKDITIETIEKTHHYGIKNIHLEYSTSKTASSLIEEVYYSTPRENSFNFSFRSSNDTTTENIDKTHQHTIKNIDSENSTPKTTSSLAAAFSPFTTDTLNNSEAKKSEINETQHCDIENETFLNEETNLVKEYVNSNHLNILCKNDITAKWCDEVSHWYKHEEKTLGAFSNTFKLEQEKEATTNVMDEEKSNLIQDSQCKEIDQYSSVKSLSSEIAYTSEATSNPIANVLQQECEETITEDGIHLPDQNVQLTFTQENAATVSSELPADESVPQNDVGKSLIQIYRRKLRPRIQKDGENSLNKPKTKMSRSTEVISSEIPLHQVNSSTEIINSSLDVAFEAVNARDKKSDLDVIYCSRCKRSFMDMASDDEAHNIIPEQNKSKLNKAYRIQTLLDLFSIDQTISSNILKGLSSEELRSGALLTQIIRFLRQKSSLVASTKMKEDVKKFLEATVDAGWVQLEGRRYRLTGDVNFIDQENENGTAAKRRKISQPKDIKSKKAAAMKEKREK